MSTLLLNKYNSTFDYDLRGKWRENSPVLRVHTQPTRVEKAKTSWCGGSPDVSCRVQSRIHVQKMFRVRSCCGMMTLEVGHDWRSSRAMQLDSYPSGAFRSTTNGICSMGYDRVSDLKANRHPCDL
jgi:hypothetical protein